MMMILNLNLMMMCVYVCDHSSLTTEVPTIEHTYSKQSNSITMEFTEVGYILRAKSEVGDSFSETVVTSSPGTVLQLKAIH
ncbi:unnamed protein product [Coregonus sp. 'balchen']|nr:unnamed protein product [Coregonus sp. 'balchen']